MKTLITILLLAWCQLSAAAPPCAPTEDSSEYTAMPVDRSNPLATDALAYVVWDCYANKIPEGALQTPGATRHCLVSDWSLIDLRRLGDRSDTIRKAADQRAAWRIAWARFVQNEADPRCLAIMKSLKDRGL